MLSVRKLDVLKLRDDFTVVKVQWKDGRSTGAEMAGSVLMRVRNRR